jgi:hypothetical protein
MMMNWRGFGRKLSWPNFMVLSWHSPGGTEKPWKTSIRIAGRQGREINPGPSELKVGVLTTRQQRSVTNVKSFNKQNIMQMKLVGMSTIFCYTKFPLSKCNSSWGVSITQSINFNFQLPSTCVYLDFTHMILLKVVYLFKIYQHTKFRGPMLTGICLASTSEVWIYTILEWLKLWDKEVWWGHLQWHEHRTEWHKNLLIGSEVIRREHTDRLAIPQASFPVLKKAD